MFHNKNNIDDIHFKTYSQYEAVATEWEEALPLNHHLTCLDIYATEIAKPEDVEIIYVSIYRKTKLIGLMYLQCLNFNSKHYHHNIFDRPVLKQLKAWIVTKTVKILICGNLFRVNFQGFYFLDKADRVLIFDCLQEYKKTIESKKEICGILLKDCSREFTETQFTCNHFKSFKQDLTMDLNINPEWKTFEDYKNDLSRKYRQRAIKIQKSIMALTVVEMDIDQLIEHKQRILTLYLNIVNNQSIALGILNEQYFIEMKKHLGPNFKVFAYFKDQELLAFASHIFYPGKNKMEIHYIGIDYAFNAEYNLYFNILFNGVDQAIRGSYRSIEMGRTAREAKANVGALPVENFNYIWIKPGLIRLVVRFLGLWFDKNIGEDWKKRNPFKTNVRKPLTFQSVES